jgi:transposase
MRRQGQKRIHRGHALAAQTLVLGAREIGEIARQAFAGAIGLAPHPRQQVVVHGDGHVGHATLIH